MKKLLSTAAVLALAATAAQAEITLQTGNASLTYSTILDEDISILGFEFATAFDAGVFGFQIGASFDTIMDGGLGGDSYTFSSADMHLYHQGNNFKVGGYFSNFYALNTYGVEGMLSMGAFDIEAYFGYLDEPGGGVSDIWMAGVKGYVDVTQGITVHASYDLIGDTGGPDEISNYAIGASYTIPNTALAVMAEYAASAYNGTTELEFINVGVTYSFGAQPDERLFSNRSFNIFSFGGI